MGRVLAGVLAVAVLATACSADDADTAPEPDDEEEGDSQVESSGDPSASVIEDWVYQLEGYNGNGLEALAEAPQQLAVIDLARDGGDEYFTAEEVWGLRASGKTVLAYFEIGSIKEERPEHRELQDDVVLNERAEESGEHFVRYWEDVWWDSVVQPRIDLALKVGFDGVYLDTLLAHRNIDASLLDEDGDGQGGDEDGGGDGGGGGGRDDGGGGSRGDSVDDRGKGDGGGPREWLGRQMADLVVRISEYAKRRDPGFQVFPQSSPELREHPGYVEAIDGLGVESLFFRANDGVGDRRCVEAWCDRVLADVQALRDAGKLILAVDFTSEPDSIQAVCERYEDEGFAGYVTTPELDRIRPPCP